MLPSFIILFAIVAGVTAEEDECVPVHIACSESERNLPNSFPETVEELDEACSLISEFLECGIAYEEKCPTSENALDVGKEFRVTLSDVCEEHGVLRPGIANNIGCLKQFFGTPTPPEGCFDGPPDEKKMEVYIKAVTDAGEIDSDDELTSRMCLIHLDAAACVLIRLEEKCGEDAMETITEILRRHATVAFLSCGEEVSKHLPTIVRLYKSMEESEEVADILSKK